MAGGAPGGTGTVKALSGHTIAVGEYRLITAVGEH
jgi:hypothetical protein